MPTPAESEQEARGCTTSADRAISRAIDGGCRRTSCGCGNALNRELAKRPEARHAQVCQRRSTCPAEGCAMEHRSASCVAGLCASRRGFGGF